MPANIQIKTENDLKKNLFLSLSYTSDESVAYLNPLDMVIVLKTYKIIRTFVFFMLLSEHHA